jgi:hypothetical protein
MMQSAKKAQSELGLSAEECVVADVTSNDLKSAMSGCSSLIIATSAKPQLFPPVLVWFLIEKYILRKEGAMPQFYFTQSPEEVRLASLD